MELSVWSHYLGRALDHVIVGFLPSSGDEYSLVSLSHTDGVLTVSSLSPDAEMSVMFPATGDNTEEPLLVYARVLQNICKQARESVLRLGYDEETRLLHVISGSATWKLQTANRTVSVSEFNVAEDPDVTIPVACMRDSIREVQYAVGGDTGRAYLSMINVDGGKFQACDGMRYHEVQTPYSDASFSINSAVLRPLLSWLSHHADEDDIRITEDSRFVHLVISLHNYLVRVSIARPAVSFPDLSNVMLRAVRAQVPSLLLINRTEFVAGLRQVKVLSDSELPIVELDLDAESVGLKCRRRGGAEATSMVPARWSSSSRAAAFDVNALIDLITSFDDENLELRFGKDVQDRKSPVALAGGDSWAMLNQIKVVPR